MRVTLTSLTKSFGSVTAVRELDLDVHSGELVALLGPSGCGKTTTLLLVAGIHRPTAGQVEFDGRTVNHVAARDRHVGMVFQSFALYPGMTVRGNLGFPLRLQSRPRSEIRSETRRMAQLLGLEHLLEQHPGQLSGGEQQRVALGRALIKRPKLLLFDEPLSNLDAPLRTALRGEIKRMHRRSDVTSIYVTHDQAEAMSLADRVAVLDGGRLLAYGPPRELYERPPNAFVAEFLGTPPMNLFEVTVERHDGRTRFALDGQQVADRPEAWPPDAPDRVIMGIRPHDVHVAGEQGIKAEVDLVEPTGSDDLVCCTVGPARLRLLAPASLAIRSGDRLQVQLDVPKAHFFHPTTRQRLE